MEISQEQVNHIARLARLKLTAEEKKRYSQQLSDVLGYAEKMNQFDTAGVEPTSQVTGLVNIVRSDQEEESGIARELIETAPKSQDGYLEVPKIFNK